ncbi:MAG: V-type ATP synthase subunit E [Deltaproteobacteria bacterium]|nr:MAG: V-type ATP synthase subunit E [Deltaproteobacteria bacterium]
MKTNRDETGLINSLRENSASKIDAIKQEAEDEIKKLERSHISDIEELKKKINDETSCTIDQELSKIRNRALIEKKKLQLRIIEDFIATMIKEAIGELRSSGKDRYKEFLLDAVDESLSQVKGKEALVYISEEDMGLEGINIKDTIMQKAGHSPDISIVVDKGITQGGAIVFDKERGLYYNSTIERIVYRKLNEIRKEVLSILAERQIVDNQQSK